MYRIAVLTDLKHEGEHYAKVINDYCINQKLFPLLETYQNQEVFFKEIQTHVPDIVLLVLPGVDDSMRQNICAPYFLAVELSGAAI